MVEFESTTSSYLLNVNEYCKPKLVEYSLTSSSSNGACTSNLMLSSSNELSREKGAANEHYVSSVMYTNVVQLSKGELPRVSWAVGIDNLLDHGFMQGSSLRTHTILETPSLSQPQLSMVSHCTLYNPYVVQTTPTVPGKPDFDL